MVSTCAGGVGADTHRHPSARPTMQAATGSQSPICQRQAPWLSRCSHPRLRSAAAAVIRLQKQAGFSTLSGAVSSRLGHRIAPVTRRSSRWCPDAGGQTQVAACPRVPDVKVFPPRQRRRPRSRPGAVESRTDAGSDISSSSSLQGYLASWARAPKRPARMSPPAAARGAVPVGPHPHPTPTDPLSRTGAQVPVSGLSMTASLRGNEDGNGAQTHCLQHQPSLSPRPTDTSTCCSSNQGTCSRGQTS